MDRRVSPGAIMWVSRVPTAIYLDLACVPAVARLRFVGFCGVEEERTDVDIGGADSVFSTLFSFLDAAG